MSYGETFKNSTGRRCVPRHFARRWTGDIYLSDDDRDAWLEVFRQACERFRWVCHAWCQMTNHYHILIETPDANLAQGMRQLNGLYTQRFNRDGARLSVGPAFNGGHCAALWRALFKGQSGG